MSWISRRRREAKVTVKGGSALILGMNGKSPDADKLCRLKRASKRVQEQSGPETAALCPGMNREPSQDQ